MAASCLFRASGAIGIAGFVLVGHGLANAEFTFIRHVSAEAQPFRYWRGIVSISAGSLGLTALGFIALLTMLGVLPSRKSDG